MLLTASRMKCGKASNYPDNIHGIRFIVPASSAKAVQTPVIGHFCCTISNISRLASTLFQTRNSVQGKFPAEVGISKSSYLQ